MELKANNELRNREKYLEHYSVSDNSYMPEDHSIQAERTLPRLAWAIGTIMRQKFKSVIDMGTKDGYLVLSLSRQSIEAKGIDLSKDAIEIARERAKKFNLNAQFQVVGIEDYVDDKVYDCSCLLEVLDRVISPDEVLKKCATLSKNLLVTVPDYYGRFGWDDDRNKERLRIFKEPEFKKLLRKYGEIKEFNVIDGAYFAWVKLF